MASATPNLSKAANILEQILILFHPLSNHSTKYIAHTMITRAYCILYS